MVRNFVLRNGVSQQTISDAYLRNVFLNKAVFYNASAINFTLQSRGINYSNVGGIKPDILKTKNLSNSLLDNGVFNRIFSDRNVSVLSLSKPTFK